MTLTINLLGGLTVETDGTPLPKLISRKADILLAYLAQEQQPTARETIATLLWEDRTQKQSMSNLRTLISSLRKHAGDFVTITRKTAVINESVWVDTAVFQQQLTFADENWPQKSAIAQAEDALALYRGEFLDGVLVDGSFELENWMQTTRDRLRHLAIGARQKLVAHYLREGDYAAGIQHAIALLQDDPLDESAHRQMMLLLAKSGQRSAAIGQYETCRQILDEEIGVEPDEETDALLRRIELADSDPAANLPVPLTTFVGRAKECLQIGELLRDDKCRLLTLLGLGGIGKTRLAVQIGHDMAGNYLNGVYFVPLAPLESVDFIVSAIAEATGLTFSGSGDPKTQLFNHLRQKEALLIFDNFEHLLSGARLMDEILRHAPNVNLLVTSRERLQLRAERLFELGGLACPIATTSTESVFVKAYDSMQLFSDRAQLVDMNFELTAVNYNNVAQICNLLQGMPLGIELAAAWARTFSCAQILAQIEQNIDFLATRMRDVPERHRSLRAVFDYVWELLSPDEQLLFVKLSLFRGGFDVAAATAVADVSPWTLVGLVEKSLLRKEGSDRYEMLEMLRRFAAVMSAEKTAEMADSRAKHAAYYADFMAERGLLLNGRRTKEAIKDIAAEMENVHAAWSYAIAQADFEIAIRIAPAMRLYYVHKGPFQEGLGLAETAVVRFTAVMETIPHPTPAQANLLAKLYDTQANLNDLLANYDVVTAAAKKEIAWGEAGENLKNQAVGYRRWSWACVRRGEYDQANTYAKKGLEMARILGDKNEEGHCARAMSIAFVRQGHYMRGIEAAERSRVLFRKTSDLWGEAKALNMLGIAYWYLGDYDKSKMYYKQALPIYEDLDNVEGRNSILGNLGLVAATQRHYEEADRLYQEILRIYGRTGNRWGESWILNNLGTLSIERLLFEDTLRYCRKASHLAAEVGARWIENYALHNVGMAYWRLGEYAQADLHYQQSAIIRDETQDAHGKGVGLHDHSWLALAQGDGEAALALARQALALGDESEDILTQAAALTGLGNALAAADDWQAAEAAYRRALPLWESLQRPQREIDARAGLVRTAVSQKNIPEAIMQTNKILNHLTEHSIYGILSPFGAYLACVQALQAAGDPRANVVLEEGQRVLGETAVSIQNPLLRDSYLQNVAVHRELMGVYYS